MSLVSFSQYISTAKYAFEQYVNSCDLSPFSRDFVKGFKTTSGVFKLSLLGEDKSEAIAILNNEYKKASHRVIRYSNFEDYKLADYYCGRRDAIAYILRELV